MQIDIFLEDVSPSPEVSETVVTPSPSSDASTADYQTDILSLMQLQLVGLGLIAGCIIALIVIRWFHHG